MNEVRRLHELAMLLAEQGHIYTRAYQFHKARAMYRAAHVLELDAASMTAHDNSKGILLESAHELEMLADGIKLPDPATQESADS